MERSQSVRYGLRFGVVLMLAAGLAAWSAAPAMARGSEVRLDPAEVSAQVEDGPFEMTVRVEGIDHKFVDRGERSEGLGIYQFSLHFDPDVVAVTDMEPGNFLGSTGRGTSCFAQIRPEDESIFDFACISAAPPDNGPQGSGVLAQLTLIPLAAGTSDLVLEGELGGPLGSSGDEIEFKVEDGSLTVTGDGPPPVPPPTPRPRPGGDNTDIGGGTGVDGPDGDGGSNDGSTDDVGGSDANGVPVAGGGWQTRERNAAALALAIALAVGGAALILSSRPWIRGGLFVPALFKNLPVRLSGRQRKDK
jgi:hypothetical protein